MISTQFVTRNFGYSSQATGKAETPMIITNIIMCLAFTVAVVWGLYAISAKAVTKLLE
jgi:hypothetical protein